MKTLKKIIILLLIVNVFFSCQKDEILEPTSSHFEDIAVFKTLDTLFVYPPIVTLYSKPLNINTTNYRDYDRIIMHNISRVDGQPLVSTNGTVITDLTETGVRIDEASGILVLTDSIDLNQGLYIIDLKIIKDNKSRVFEDIYHFSIEGAVETTDIPFRDTTITVAIGDTYSTQPPVYTLNGYDPIIFSLYIYDSAGDGHNIYETKEEWEQYGNKDVDYYGIALASDGHVTILPKINMPAGTYSMSYGGGKWKTWLQPYVQYGSDYLTQQWYDAFPRIDLYFPGSGYYGPIDFTLLLTD